MILNRGGGVPISTCKVSFAAIQVVNFTFQVTTFSRFTDMHNVFLLLSVNLVQVQKVIMGVITKILSIFSSGSY